MKFLLSLCSIALLSTSLLRASTINWRSRVVLMDGVSGAAQVELGSFGNFTPTRENVAEWLGNWQGVDSAPYDEANGLFASSVDYSGDFTGPVYLWLADFSGNWLLLTNPNWAWPSSGFPPPFPRDFFTTDSGTVAVLGTLTQGSAIEHLETESVSAPAHPSIYSGWLRAQNLSEEPGDADGDGFSNLEEFARGGDPNIAGDLVCVSLVSQPFTQLVIPGTLHPQVRLELLSSIDLKSWSVWQFESVMQNSERILRPTTSGSKRFFQVRYLRLE